MGRLIKRRNGGAKLIPVQETAVHFYQSCTNWTLRNAVGLEPLRDVLSNLSVRYWPLLDVYGEEYNAPRILLRLLLRLRLDVFVSLRVQRSLRTRSHYVLNPSAIFAVPLCPLVGRLPGLAGAERHAPHTHPLNRSRHL
ncbi:hypothetical protein HPB51_018653 [Rhipicephalus microplus]|uniref:Uncharacterized protein n=1 Tax=Rhipicephalus microplus TaxID=6941 RepID=A0A9J6F5A4_RHIMP|nr:hypothetical protein HPB51_018653 [Rhipicephalus microplus]